MKAHRFESKTGKGTKMNYTDEKKVVVKFKDSASFTDKTLVDGIDR